ncbi:MAG: siroheme synthase [Caulobacteraceae bacterium]
MEAFPAFFPLAGRRVVIAGEGHGADAKARLFAASPAEVVRLKGVAAGDPVRYAGATLAFVAGGDPLFREEAAAAAREAGVPVNVVDEPRLCDFHTPAVIDRGQVVAAVGTAGAAPLLASMLRSEIEALMPAGLGDLAALLGRRRDAIQAAFPDLGHRRAFLRRVIEGPLATTAADDPDGAEKQLDDALASAGIGEGLVSIIQAGATDLLSLRALRVLASADLLAAPDGLQDLAALARRDVVRLAPGGAEPGRLTELAAAGRRVAVIVEGGGAELASHLRALAVTVEFHLPAPSPLEARAERARAPWAKGPVP